MITIRWNNSEFTNALNEVETTALLGKVGRIQFLKKAGMVITGIQVGRLRRGVDIHGKPLAPLSKNTRTSGRVGQTPLIRTGGMMRSIDIVELEYARNFATVVVGFRGTDPEGKSYSDIAYWSQRKGKNKPERRFFGLVDRDIDVIESLLFDVIRRNQG